MLMMTITVQHIFLSWSEFKPSSWLNFLTILQPFHLNLWIRNLNSQFNFLPLWHLIGRIQLFEESCVSEDTYKYNNQILLGPSAVCYKFCKPTCTFLLLFLHLLQSLEHASKVSDAMLKGNLLVFWSRSMAENVPDVHIRLCAMHSSKTCKPARSW